MLKSLSFFMLLTFSVQAFSQSCLKDLMATKKSSYFDRLSDDKQKAIGFLSTFGGLAVGITVASSAFPAFVIAASIAASPILAGEAIKGIHNRPINRMIKLILQSNELAKNPEAAPGRLLRKTHENLQKQGSEISIQQLAQAIADANKSGNCSGIHRVKSVDEAIISGQLPVVEI